MFILLLLYYFYEKMAVVSKIPLYNSITFWICVGLFIYFTGNFFFYVMSSSIKDLSLKNLMVGIYATVSITKDIILSLAWLAHERTETNSDILRIPDEMQLDDDFIVSKQNNV